MSRLWTGKQTTGKQTPGDTDGRPRCNWPPRPAARPMATRNAHSGDMMAGTKEKNGDRKAGDKREKRGLENRGQDISGPKILTGAKFLRGLLTNPGPCARPTRSPATGSMPLPAPARLPLPSTCRAFPGLLPATQSPAGAAAETGPGCSPAHWQAFVLCGRLGHTLVSRPAA